MIETTFLNWDKPLLTKLIPHLLQSAENLAESIIIVPTVQSGRRLRKALAEAGISLAPRVSTPEILLPDNNAGTRCATFTAWVKVLLDLELDKARGLFPKDPPTGVIHSFRWAFNVAKQLCELQQTLQQNGKTFQEISRISQESERWNNLAMLDSKVTTLLQKWQLQAPSNKTPSKIPTEKKIIIAGVCDLSARAIQQLENHTKIEIIIHAPENHREHFDTYGRPLSDFWTQCDLPLPDWKKNIIIAENPKLAANQVITQIANKQLTSSDITLGICDRDMALSTQHTFASAGWKLYDPDGKNIGSSSLLLFLTYLGEWFSQKGQYPIGAFAKLLRLPEIEAFIKRQNHTQTDRFSIIRELDQCIEKRIPHFAQDLNEYLQQSEASVYPLLTPHLNHFLTESENMLKGNKCKGLRSWIARALKHTDPDIALLLVDDISEIMDTFETVEARLADEPLNISQIIEILTDSLSNKKHYTNYSESVLDMLDWMEIIYEDSDNLFLAGLHEGHIPETHGDDPFLPNSFRETLGMQSGNLQYARDSYLFQSYIESRSHVHISLSKLSDSNEPKNPSRLLFRTSGKNLAERVKKFFGEAQIKSKNPSAWQRDWQLTLPELTNPYAPDNDPVRQLSPTALRQYLHCPLRFFLKRIVRMERYEAQKNEMNALDFGLLVHAVVEKFGRDTSMRDSISVHDIQRYFDDLLEKETFSRYGSNPNLAIKIQTDIAKSRLHRLAHLQAEETAAGWRIIDVELDIGNDIHWEISGHPIKMQIDRVDQHQQTGELRVMDYKTSSKATDPLQAHIVNFVADENRPLCGDLLPKLPRGKSERRWKDLQLPIYAWFAKQHYKSNDTPSVGYINLPNTLSDTRFTIWDTFNHELLDSAQTWAENAIKEIQQGKFFIPADLPNKEENWDEYSKLAQGNIKEAFGL